MQTISDSQFESLVSSNKFVLVDFFAEWCAPCRQMTPVLEEVASDLGDSVVVVKLNIDESPETAQKFGITSIPTLLFFDNGSVVKKIIGLKDKDTLLKDIKDMINIS